jgi:hypothetical protein
MATDGRKIRVLIVEDSEDDALLIADELESCGAQLDYLRVETPEQMTAALEMALREPEREEDKSLVRYTGW